MSAQPTLPAFQGQDLFPDVAVDEQHASPLSKLLHKLYASGRLDDVAPTSHDTIVLNTYDHDCAILREPFTNAHGVSTRACLAGDDCQGRSPHLPGHERAVADGKSGVTLTEMMDARELDDFLTNSKLPNTRRLCLLCSRFNLHKTYLFARKNQCFPSTFVLNTFVNAAGEGEYDEKYLVPHDDAGQFTGLYGTVAGLHFNALKLVKVDDADPKSGWRVDQSAMKHEIATATCNAATSALYSGFVEPRLWLLAFYKYRLRVTDAHVLFLTFDELNEARPKLDFPAADTLWLPWPECATRSFLHRLLHYRVNRLQNMIVQQSCAFPPIWRYHMQLYLDAHLPMAALFKKGVAITHFSLKYPACQETLPDFSKHCVSAALNCIIPAGLPAAARKQAMNTSNAALIQLLIRAMPEFSQVRALHTAMGKCLGYRDLVAPLFKIFQCALLGNFHDSKNQLTFNLRMNFIHEFTETTVAEIVRAMPPTEQLTLFCMRAYFHIALPLCPPLLHLIRTIAPLTKQRERVFDALKMVRQTPQTEDDWWAFFRPSTMEALKKANKRLPKRKTVPRGLLDMSNALVETAKRALSKRGIKRSVGSLEAPFDPTYFQAVAKRPRLEATHGDERAAFGGIADKMLEKIESEPLKKPVVPVSEEEASDADLQRLFDFAAATDFREMFQVKPLPPRINKAARDAVCRRFGGSTPDVLRRVDVVCCAACGIRNFELSHAERRPVTKRANHVRACGLKKVALDVDTQRQCCVETPSCSKMDLFELNILGDEQGNGGGILLLRNTAVVVSSCCGFLVQASSVRVTPTGFDCAACASTKKAEMLETPDPRICAHCSKRTAITQALQNCVYLRDSKGRVQKFGFCKSHLRAWAKTSSGYLTLAFVSKNMTNRSGQGLVLNPT